jgi:hypothetical protein
VAVDILFNVADWSGWESQDRPAPRSWWAGVFKHASKGEKGSDLGQETNPRNAPNSYQHEVGDSWLDDIFWYRNPVYRRLIPGFLPSPCHQLFTESPTPVLMQSVNTASCRLRAEDVRVTCIEDGHRGRTERLTTGIAEIDLVVQG